VQDATLRKQLWPPTRLVVLIEWGDLMLSGRVRDGDPTRARDHADHIITGR
jgi:hypothetical protein